MSVKRLQIDVKRLLAVCEEMAQNNSSDDWRLSKYIEAVSEMIAELIKKSNIEKDIINEYTKRMEFLKGFLNTKDIENTEEKLVALEMLEPVHVNNSRSKNIKQKFKITYANQLRDELLGNELKTSSNIESSDNLDELLKHHQNKQESVAEELMSITKSLREHSELAGKIIKKDIEVLEKSSKGMDDNFENLKREEQRLSEFVRKSSWRCWIWVLAVAMFAIFIKMILFIRITKKN
ncbi:vesicle transport protein USE1 [Daktulosphaira vitifoliae]|uniref:vesicle transport protein USE1 n=1 Tax=Daktulosphaira vitifoliae TaxID=58002 RepID=UPI0021AA58FA|nr:vesicle transport protein USE1 [Daktulosphaira vitifoliae]